MQLKGLPHLLLLLTGGARRPPFAWCLVSANSPFAHVFASCSCVHHHILYVANLTNKQGKWDIAMLVTGSM